MKTNTLYLTSTDYNTQRLLDRIEQIVVANGGKLEKRDYEKYTYFNRSISEKIREEEKSIERINFLIESKIGNGADKQLAHIEKIKNEIEILKEMYEKSAYKSKGWKWIGARHNISFVADGVYMALNFDDNPLFPKHITKHHIEENGDYMGEYYGEEIELPFYDCLWSYECTDAQIDYCANDWYNRMIAAKCSQIVPRKQNRYWGKTRTIVTA